MPRARARMYVCVSTLMHGCAYKDELPVLLCLQFTWLGPYANTDMFRQLRWVFATVPSHNTSVQAACTQPLARVLQPHADVPRESGRALIEQLCCAEPSPSAC